MNAPVCSTCYAETLPPDQRARFNAEPVTSCIYLCGEHQRAVDDLFAAMPLIQYARRDQRE